MAVPRRQAGKRFRTFRRPAQLALQAALGLALAAAAGSAFAQGIYVPSVGPVNQSMSGAAVAAPIDSIGALNWNPATISALPSCEIAFGLGLVLPTTSVSSEVGPFSGTSESEPGVCPIPTIGLVLHADDNPWTIGLGIFGVGGFSTNYAASTPAGSGNPIFFPQSIGGFGRVVSHGEFYQIVPTISYAVSDRFSVGIAPILTLARLTADPLVFAPPNNADVSDPPSYGPGSGTRVAWGGGFQAGAYYTTDSCWQFGAAYKSQQWMESFRFNSEDELGGPLFAEVRADLPSITSLGIAYAGYSNWLLATDFRYFDFANATGFGDQGIRPDGAVAGLGWQSVWSVSQGVQYCHSDRLTLRTGYTYNENPITSEVAMFNVGTSLIIQHWYSLGMTYQWSPCVGMHLAWTHGFENQVTGPILTQPPGSTVTERVSADIVNFGVSVAF